MTGPEEYGVYTAALDDVKINLFMVGAEYADFMALIELAITPGITFCASVLRLMSEAV